MSGAGESRDGPSGARVVELGLLLSHTREPWDDPDGAWLALLGLASSQLSLEAVRAEREVSSTGTQPRGSAGHCGAHSPPPGALATRPGLDTGPSAGAPACFAS